MVMVVSVVPPDSSRDRPDVAREMLVRTRVGVHDGRATCHFRQAIQFEVVWSRVSVQLSKE